MSFLSRVPKKNYDDIARVYSDKLVQITREKMKKGHVEWQEDTERARARERERLLKMEVEGLINWQRRIFLVHTYILASK